MKKVLVFEFVMLIVCTILFITAESERMFVMEQFATMTFFIVVNIFLLLLCYTMGLLETFEGEERFKGMINIITVIIFSALFFILWTVILVYVCLNG